MLDLGRNAETWRTWCDYRSVWRWHFYAGLFCIPFVLWLAATGSIYLFRPQIEAWLDRPYDALAVDGPRARPEAQVQAALAAVPGRRLNSYELPKRADSSVRVLVGRGADLFRVYVHPATAQVLHIVREDQRPMRRLFYLHGELLMGITGSMVVETAASWAIVMIVSGLFLWWPRKSGLAGVIYPRLWRGGRVFWRDLHAVTGLWVSFFTLFVLLSGLPWARSWGNLLQDAGLLGGAAATRLDWTTGRDSEIRARVARNAPPVAPSGEHAAHEATAATSAASYAGLDRLVAVVDSLHLEPPVLVSPPSMAAHTWTARSDAADRVSRTEIELDMRTATITSRVDFGERPLVDRVVGIGIAAHEGQLSGRLNQVMGLFTAASLWIVAISSVVLWWKRKPANALGAPSPQVGSPRIPALVKVLTVALALAFPMMGATLLAILAIERGVFVRVPAAARFFGLSPA